MTRKVEAFDVQQLFDFSGVEGYKERNSKTDKRLRAVFSHVQSLNDVITPSNNSATLNRKFQNAEQGLREKKIAPSLSAFLMYEYHCKGLSPQALSQSLSLLTGEKLSRRSVEGIMRRMKIPNRSVDKPQVFEEESRAFYFPGDGGDPMNFADFLHFVKNQREATWAQLEEKVGMNGLSVYASSRRGFNPTQETVFRIVDKLGFSRDDFLFGNGVRHHVYGIPDLESPEFDAWLRKIGNWILERNKQMPEGREQLFSSYAIITAASELFSTDEGDFTAGSFYSRYGSSFDQRRILHERLIALDSKYAGIGLQNRPNNGNGHENPLTADELNVIENVLAEIAVSSNSSVRLPRGTYNLVEEALSNLSEDQRSNVINSRSKLMSVVREIWYGPKESEDVGQNTGTGSKRGPIGSPKPLEVVLNEQIQNLDNETGNSIDDIVDQGREKTPEERKKLYFEITNHKHQMLVAFLMNPENYRKYFGENLKLLKVDFDLENTCSTLYEKHKQKLEELGRESADPAVVDFIDKWQKCDMVFRDTRTREYVVVEVKQYATDKPGKGHKTATKARQQLASYVAIMEDNIRRKNARENQDGNLDFNIPENVVGVLAAYEVHDWLKDHLNSRGSRVAIIPKEEVIKYAELIGEDYNLRQTTGMNREGETVVDSARSISVIDLEREKYEQRRHNFAEFTQLMEEVPEEITTGTYDRKNGLVELQSGLIYSVNGDIRHLRYLLECVSKGILRTGRVNKKKAEWSPREVIRI